MRKNGFDPKMPDFIWNKNRLHKDFRLTIKYFPLSLAERPKEFSISVGEYVTLNEIQQKIVDYLALIAAASGQGEAPK